jgi:hypothetical protein
MIATSARAGLAVLVVLAAGLLPGCGEFFGFAGHVLSGPETVEAQYEIPSDTRLLVFVDDIKNPLSYPEVKRRIGRRVGEHLTDENHRVVRDVVPQKDLIALVAGDPEFYTLSIAEVGNKVGADIVLYVHIDRFELREDPASPIWKGRLEASALLVDVHEGMKRGQPRLWPTNRPDGQPIDPPVTTPSEQDPSPRFGLKLTNRMCDTMADRIAKLFYEHQVDPRDEAYRPPDE